jgi:CBS domain-containing protein
MTGGEIVSDELTGTSFPRVRTQARRERRLALRVVTLRFAMPEATPADLADTDVAVASPTDDAIEVTTRMADFNLRALPVDDAL